MGEEMRKTKISLIQSLSMLAVVLVSCGSGEAGENRLDPQEIRATALHLAETSMASTEAVIPDTPLPSPTILPTDTPLPSPTPTPTLIPTRITTLQNANCRNGPGLEYRILFTYDKQLTFPLAGRNDESTWWYVEPDNLEEGCWFSGEVTAVEGDVAALDVVEASGVPLIGADSRYISYYLIAEHTGGTVACGDSLIAINTGILRTGDPAEDVRIALASLLAIGSPYSSGFKHSGYQSNLQVVSSEYSSSTLTVTVTLTGTVVKPEDNCDKERFRVQLFTTAQQFSDVAKAYIWVGSRPIGDYLVPTK